MQQISDVKIKCKLLVHQEITDEELVPEACMNII
jgi:hypothetical protein